MESILAFSLLFRYYKMLRSRTRWGTNRLILLLFFPRVFFFIPSVARDPYRLEDCRATSIYT